MTGDRVERPRAAAATLADAADILDDYALHPLAADVDRVARELKWRANVSAPETVTA